MKKEVVIGNYKWGCLANIATDHYRVWNKRLGAAVLILLALGVVYNIGLLEWREFHTHM